MLKRHLPITIVTVIAIFLLSATVAFAMFTDTGKKAVAGAIGTVKISNDLKMKNNSGTWSDSGVSNWNPGDVNGLRLQVQNLGNKSVYTRTTFSIFWDEVPDLAEAGVIYLYPANMTDNEIRADIATGNPTKAINVGTEQTYTTLTGTTRKGFRFVLDGDVLDGTGLGKETGDASEQNYNVPGAGTGASTDDSLTTIDNIEFKLAFNANAISTYMGKKYKIEVITEARQYRNATSDWTDAAIVFESVYGGSYVAGN